MPIMVGAVPDCQACRAVPAVRDRGFRPSDRRVYFGAILGAAGL